MGIKKGLKKGAGIVGMGLFGLAVAAIWLVRIPPKIVSFVLNNKIKSLLLASAVYFGYGKIHQTVQHKRDIDIGVDRIRQEIRAQERLHEVQGQQAQTSAVQTLAQSVQQATTNQTLETSSTTNAPTKSEKKPHPMQVATAQVMDAPVITNAVPKASEQKQPESQLTPEAVKLTKEAADAVEKHAFASSPDVDMVNRSGDRAAPAGTRFQYFLNKGMADNGATQKGENTVLIRSQTNPNDYAVLYVGFHDMPKDGAREKLLYNAYLQTPNGRVPYIGGFNICFPETPGVRFGIVMNEQGVKFTSYQNKSPAINVDQNGGRTLLQVDGQGTLSRVYDAAVIGQAFGAADVSRTAPVDTKPFTVYEDFGAPKRSRSQGRTVNVPRPRSRRGQGR